MNQDQVASFVLKHHSGRTYITIDEAIALVSAALMVEQGQSGHVGWHKSDRTEPSAETPMPPVYRSRNVA